MSKLGHNNPPAEQNGGWIAVRRAMRDHWLVGFGQPVKPCDPERGAYSRAEAFIDLIMECRYEAGTVNNNGRKMRIQPGQLLGAVSWLASRWNWTPKTVRGFLDKLEDDGMIERGESKTNPRPDHSSDGSKPGNQKGRFANIISICNYALYQIVDRQQGPVEGHVEGELRAGSGPVEGNIYKDNKGTREQGNKGTSINDDLEELEGQLLEACNGALDNPVNCQGLLSLAIPKMWLDEGCDLQMDILPTLRAVGKKAHGKKIQTWKYFSKAVGDAKRAREKGLVSFNEAGDVETQAERLARFARETEQKMEHRK
jgi:hypothetical protein